MQSLYQQLIKKYPFCAFGYIDNGLVMQISVVSKRYKKDNVRMRNLELEKSLQYYANQYMEMIREIHSANDKRVHV